MKIAHLQNLKRPVLICELPDDVTYVRINPMSHFGIEFYSKIDGWHNDGFYLPPGDWDKLGWLTELKEEQFAGFVEETDYSCWEVTVYLNYNDPRFGYFSPKKSFLSAVEAEGWTWQNPLGKEPKMEDYILKPERVDHLRMIQDDEAGQKPTWASIFERNYSEKLHDWEAAQERVLDLERCFLIVNKEGI